jgi:hypothetical protein
LTASEIDSLLAVGGTDEQLKERVLSQFDCSYDAYPDADGAGYRAWLYEISQMLRLKVPLMWNPEKLRFQNTVLDAWVARSPRRSVLELEMDALRPKLAKDTALVLRGPPAIQGEVIGHSLTGLPHFKWTFPDEELWKIQGLGSFDSIRFARAVFNSPKDEKFLEGVDSLEAIIAMLSEGFAEGDFRLYQANDSYLFFDLAKPNARVTRVQYALLDKLKQRFFEGPHTKAARLGVPNTFCIGSAG